MRCHGGGYIRQVAVRLDLDNRRNRLLDNSRNRLDQVRLAEHWGLWTELVDRSRPLDNISEVTPKVSSLS